MSSRREVLARQAAARLYAAACREEGELWNTQEQLHEQATTADAAQAAAAPLVQLCGGCPIVAECQAWAVIDEYTGIAAGSAWVNGKEKPTCAVRAPLPPRRLAS